MKASKGFSHIDFIVAASIFLIVFGFVLQTMTDFVSRAEMNAEITTITGKSLSLLGLADYEFEPRNWTGNGTLMRIGLATKSYNFFIVANNTMPFLINQSQNVSVLLDELISFNFSSLGYTIDINSTHIYDDDGNAIRYFINSDLITFAFQISINQTKVFRIHFDDDSNFTSRSVSISGSNSINETVFPVLPLVVLQYEKILALNRSIYGIVRNDTGIGDFRITIFDMDSSINVIDYGGDIPNKGDIVALQRYALMQNSTSGIRNARIVVRSW